MATATSGAIRCAHLYPTRAVDGYAPFDIEKSQRFVHLGIAIHATSVVHRGFGGALLITIKQVNNDTVIATQTVNRPTVYLDQWMWCRLSEDAAIRDSFLNAARTANATIMYSIVSFLELGKISDSQQISTIKYVMDELDFGFIEINPRIVIDAEIGNETTQSTFADLHPAVDRGLMKYIASHLY